jgi:citronellol/citronellal dehydrogenase
VDHVFTRANDLHHLGPLAGSDTQSRCVPPRTARTSSSRQKTTEPHPKLPGTIHTAAADVEAAGGKALAIATDIRDEAQVEAAIAAAVGRFGGIDILVNNASAISLTGTMDTR